MKLIKSLKLQQYLPFTVLKQHPFRCNYISNFVVATVPTVYGIETQKNGVYIYEIRVTLQQYLPFTVLKLVISSFAAAGLKALQQYLPFTVLKQLSFECFCWSNLSLQQYLPFTVLKLLRRCMDHLSVFCRCNSIYHLRY